jgi:hypothetical protein
MFPDVPWSVPNVPWLFHVVCTCVESDEQGGVAVSHAVCDPQAVVVAPVYTPAARAAVVRLPLLPRPTRDAILQACAVLVRSDYNPFREHLGNIQGTFREHSGNIQGTVREHSGNIQGTFREHSGNIQGTLAARAAVVRLPPMPRPTRDALLQSLTTSFSISFI